MVSATAKTYGSGVIRSKRKRKREVTFESGVREFDGDKFESGPEFGLTFGVAIGSDLNEAHQQQRDLWRRLVLRAVVPLPGHL
jgi:hypothetical protein